MGSLSCLTILLAVCVWQGGAAPVQTEHISELKNELDTLKDVLQKLSDDVTAIEEERGLGPQPPPEAQPDQELADFEHKLSPEDQDLLRRMKSKVKYLQATLHEKVHVDPAESEEEQERRRGINPQIKALFSRLSPEDQKLLLAHPSKIEALEKAYASLPQAQAAEEREEAQNEDKDKQDILDKIKGKFTSLKQAMSSQKDGSKEGEFGAFVEGNTRSSVQKNRDEETWAERAYHAERLGGGQKRSQSDVSELKASLLSELVEAKNSGLKENDILKALKERKARDIEDAYVENEEMDNYIM